MSESANNKSGNTNQSIFTRETFGVVTVLFATLCLVCLITGESVFSLPGLYVSTFLFGLFGIFAYLVVAFAFVLGIFLVVGKKTNISKKNKILISLATILAVVIFHIISMGNPKGGYGEYLSTSYLRGQGGIATASAGGFFAGLIAYPVSALLTAVGGGVVMGVLLGVLVYFIIASYVKNKSATSHTKGQALKSSYVKLEDDAVEISGTKDYPINVVPQETTKPTQKLFVNDSSDFAFKTKKELNRDDVPSMKVDFSQGGLGISHTSATYSQSYAEEMKKKIEYIKTPTKLNMEDIKNKSNTYISSNLSMTNKNIDNEQGVKISEPIKKEEKSNEIPFYEHNAEKSDSTISRAQAFAEKYAYFEGEKAEEKIEPKEVFRTIDSSNGFSEKDSTSFDNSQSYNVAQEIPNIEETPEVEEIPNIEETTDVDEIAKEEQINLEKPFSVFEQPKLEEEQPPVSNITRANVFGESSSRRMLFGENEKQEKVMGGEELSANDNTEKTEISNNKDFSSTSRRALDVFASHRLSVEKEGVEQEEKPKKVEPPINRKYNRPPLDLLENYTRPAGSKEENHQERMAIIKRTLEEFHINAEPQNFVQGPSITRYEIMMPAGISVKKVLPFDDDLKMRLESKDGVRIEAPIPGKNLVGIEVANKNKITVGLREVIEGSVGKPEKKGSLIYAIGKDIVGNSITDNLADGPHFLVAGSTGSGKSVCLNLMIVSMIMKYSPEDLRLILIDPKGVEFRPYEHLPHLMIDEIITEPKKALAVLKWAYDEMERRYKKFQEHPGIVKIEAYNEQIANETTPKMPRIVVIVDELSNLMETCKRDMEARILSIAQKARAAGIHLVLATQRPSVDVITGTIKANLPSRIALRVMNYADSNTILSEGGAEKLLGNGDMLYKNSSMSECERYQGAYISTSEVNNVVKYIIENNEAYFNDELTEFLENETRPHQEETSVSQEDGSMGMSVGNQELLIKCMWHAIRTKTVSISQLQRRFQIGYARAGSIVDKMERMGFVSPNEGSKARRVLITREEMIEKFGPEPDEYFDDWFSLW